MKNRIIGLLLILCLSIGGLSGCGNKTSDLTQKDSEMLHIVCTTFPQYDWIREILGDEIANAEVTLLLDKGVDIHNYQPSAADIAEISKSDVFIYVGGESDKWVQDILKEPTNQQIKAISMMDVLGDRVKEEEIVEGMEEHDVHTEGHKEHETEYDEHVWLSLNYAEEICKEIAAALKEISPSKRTVYEDNLKAYVTQLQELNQEYETVVKEAKNHTIIFGDRFPFRYLLDDYGLEYFAAFPGCSAETEASFETIIFLANKMDELNLRAICVIENTNETIAQTIIQSTKDKEQNILTLNSMQAVTRAEINSGTTYLSIMKSNLEIVKQALNK